MSAATNPVISRRHVIIGGALAATAVVCNARMPITPAKRSMPGMIERALPAEIGEWTYATRGGIVLPPPDAVRDRLYDDVVTRAYGSGTREPVMVALAYSNLQDGLLQIHRPEFCYTAGGFHVSRTDRVDVTDAAGVRHGANVFTAVAPGRIEQVLFWTRIGETFPQSWAEQRLAVLKANLKRATPDGLLARFSVIEEDRSVALRTLQEFVIALDKAAPPTLQQLFFGRT